MKKNYTFKTIKTGLAIFAMVFSFANANAQTEEVLISSNIRTVGTTVYAGGAIDIVTSEQTVEGTTFKIQVTLTPNSTASGSGAYIESNGNNRYGVDGASIDGDLVETITTSNLTVIDFNPGETSYTVDAISDIHFTGVTLFNMNGANDQPLFTIVGGTNPGTFNIGQGAARSGTITFGTPYTNGADPAVETTVGSTTGVTAFTLGNGSTEANDSYQIIGTNWALTFTKDTTLGVNTINKKDDALTIFPTVTDGAFSVNKAFETLQLFDLTGKAVKTFKSSDALEVSGIGSGLYIVKIQSEVGAISTGKLIVK
ncbi:T9SS type A sorting domain-containing protein [Polaribacter sp.]|uniref:T9SS type A sorting domain-containing protein n=1 Tax=Polaribacter sp. TaxID=1920175 RepID=UPI003EF93093